MGMNRRSFYKLCLVGCLAFLATVLIFQRWGVDLLEGGSVSERIPLTVMKETGFLVLEAHIEDRAIRMAVDTAANRTIFDIGLIEELQLPPADKSGISFHLHGGDVRIQAAHVKSFKVGNFSYYGDFCFMDLSRPNMGIEHGGGIPIEGLLGAELLAKWNAVIDYEDLSLVIRKD